MNNVVHSILLGAASLAFAPNLLSAQTPEDFALLRDMQMQACIYYEHVQGRVGAPSQDYTRSPYDRPIGGILRLRSNCQYPVVHTFCFIQTPTEQQRCANQEFARNIGVIEPFGVVEVQVDPASQTYLQHVCQAPSVPVWRGGIIGSYGTQIYWICQ